MSNYSFSLRAQSKFFTKILYKNKAKVTICLLRSALIFPPSYIYVSI